MRDNESERERERARPRARREKFQSSHCLSLCVLYRFFIDGSAPASKRMAMMRVSPPRTAAGVRGQGERAREIEREEYILILLLVPLQYLH